jgi:hypothetical protein
MTEALSMPPPPATEAAPSSSLSPLSTAPPRPLRADRPAVFFLLLLFPFAMMRFQGGFRKHTKISHTGARKFSPSYTTDKQITDQNVFSLYYNWRFNTFHYRYYDLAGIFMLDKKSTKYQKWCHQKWSPS